MTDLLFDDGAVKIVDPEGQRNLGDLLTQHDPVGLDMVEVIEEYPCDRQRHQVIEAGSPFDLQFQIGVFRLKRQRDKGLESVCFVLQLPQHLHVRDPVGSGLDVAVEHRGVALQAGQMRQADDLQPAPSRYFLRADLLPDLLHQDFGTATRHGAETGADKALKHLLDRQAGNTGKIFDLHGGEGFDMELRCGMADGPQGLFVELERQVGVQAADDMHFGGSFTLRRDSPPADFVQRQGVGAVLAGGSREGAEGAAVDADVGRVYMAVDVEKNVLAVFACVDLGGQFTYPQQVVGLEQEQRLVRGNALTGADFCGYGFEGCHERESTKNGRLVQAERSGQLEGSDPEVCREISGRNVGNIDEADRMTATVDSLE